MKQIAIINTFIFLYAILSGPSEGNALNCPLKLKGIEKNCLLKFDCFTSLYPHIDTSKSSFEIKKQKNLKTDFFLTSNSNFKILPSEIDQNLKFHSQNNYSNDYRFFHSGLSPPV